MGSSNMDELARERASLERHGYLFGQKIAASMSPQFHQVIFDELGRRWAQLRLDSGDIAQFLELVQDPKCFGVSVTMPHKLAIMEHLDEITPECRDVGACNTIFFRDDEDDDTNPTTTEGSSSSSSTSHKRSSRRRRLYGTNTDVVGVRESFYRNISDPDAIFHYKPALVIGGGGAARSAVYALWKWMRASKIYIVNRDVSEVEALMRDCNYSSPSTSSSSSSPILIHVSTVEQAESVEAPGAIVACVPDFTPRTADEKTARAVVETFLRKDTKGAMLEMCYNPTPYTELYHLATNEGWQVMLGTETMMWQGFESSKLWTGLDINDLPVEKCKEKIAALLSSK